MTLSQLRRRVNALKGQSDHELAIIRLRRIAETVANDWTPSDPPEPADVIRRIVKAGFRLTTFASLRRYLDDTRRKGDVPLPNTIVLRLLPGPGTTAAIHCCAGTFRPCNHGHFPQRVRVSVDAGGGPTIGCDQT